MSKVIAMKVASVEDHPNADSLKMYWFEAPEHENRFVIANLENVYEPGDLAYVAHDGSVLEDGTKIRASRIRGVMSYGMALGHCSEGSAGDIFTDKFCKEEETNDGASMVKWPGIESFFNVKRGIQKFAQSDIPWAIPTIHYVAKVKVDGCFHRSTDIILSDGTKKKISQIKPGDCVFGFDFQTNKIIPSKVLNTYNNGKTSEWVKVSGHRTGNRSDCKSGIFSLQVTPNHLFWCSSKNEYVPANKLLAGDKVLLFRNFEHSLTFVQEQVLLGKMLGDGTLMSTTCSSHISWGHTDKDKDYVKWTCKALGESLAPTNTITKHKSGYDSVIYRARTINSAHIKNKFQSFINAKNNKKHIPEWVIEDLNPLSLAFWYMDDGSLSHNETQRDRAVFHTCNFTVEDCNVLIKALKKFNINAKMRKCDEQYPTLYLDTNSSEILFSLIAPYIPPCMERKLPEYYRGSNGWLPKIDSHFKPSIVEREIIDVKKYTSQDTKWDIETETKNYFAKGVLVHNSNAAVQITSDGQVVAQSRSNIITPQSDNMGFARWVHDNMAYFEAIRDARDAIDSKDNIVIFGEWAGSGIQKRTSISQIDRKVFAVFAIQVSSASKSDMVVDPKEINNILYAKHDDIFILPWVEDSLTVINFADHEGFQSKVDKINQLVADVEACDPWVKATFGIEGIGEGVVMYPTHQEIKEGPKLIRDRTSYSLFVFKAKGEKHQVVKTKKAVQIDPEVAKSIDEFVNLFMTEARLDQGVTVACDGEFDMKKMGNFLKWFVADVQKESEAELEAAGLKWKQVNKGIMTAARKWYQEKVNSV